MRHEDEELVRELLLELLVLLIVQPCVLQGVDDYEVWGALALEALGEDFYRLSVEDQEAPPSFLHSASAHVVLEGE